MLSFTVPALLGYTGDTDDLQEGIGEICKRGSSPFVSRVQCGAPVDNSVQLVHINSISQWFMIPITIVSGVNIPSNQT